MKESAKKALKHDVEVLGKRIPVLAVAALFVIGAGSAAVLTNFGTVEGTATVDQAITVEGNSYSPDSAEFSYSYDVVGGALEEESFSLQNNAESPVAVSLSTTVDDPNAQSGDEGYGEGVDTRYIVSEQWAVDDSETSDDSSYDTVVEAADPVASSGDYSLHFYTKDNEDPGNDYAIAYFPVESLGQDSVVTYTGTVDGDNPLDDEIWLVTADGEKYYAHGATSMGPVTYDLSEKTWYNVDQEQATPQWNDVVAVGVGQGAPSEASGDYRVDTYIDDVEVDDSNVDELADPEVHVVPTGDYEGLESRVEVGAVTSFAVNIAPGDYGVNTAVAPAQ